MVDDIMQLGLADYIRNYSRSQADLWQRVPYLATEADAFDDTIPFLQSAYRFGHWIVEESFRDGIYRVFVDLENGELVDSCAKTYVRPPAPDDEIVGIEGWERALDASRIVTGLEERIAREAERSVPGLSAWREENRRLFNVTDPYVREYRPLIVTPELEAADPDAGTVPRAG